ncbi:MAG: rRNA biogenesis protein [Nanoarchaeota archaeon]|nr:rRNA biogenesis protein [Nanoarchaeota archaeon]
MVKYISACILGVFVIEDDKIIDKVLFRKNAKDIAEKLNAITITEEYKELKAKYDVGYQEPDYLNANIRKIALEVKFVEDQGELNKLMSEISVERTKLLISAKEKRDKLIIQAVCALNDLDKLLNYMSERLREWYGLHYPELRVKDHEKLSEFIEEYGVRENFPEFDESMGMKLEESDVKILKEYAKQTKNMYKLKKKIVAYLEDVVPKEIPNINALLGPVLAARLLSHAGSLEKLAKMPSSKLQLVGAEKALFKYLKGDQKSVPRFGILFTHPDISTAPREKQGKIARYLSAKLTLAARADFYSKEDISKRLVSEYKAKLKEI